MTSPSLDATEGNLFAFVLYSILAEKNLDWKLSALDDRYYDHPMTNERLRIVHPEKVHRLQQSIGQFEKSADKSAREISGKFPTLNPDELKRVIEAFGLESERLRLHAAILATSVQKLLTDQGMTPAGALKAAELVMPVILEVLQEMERHQDLMGSFRGDAHSALGGLTMEETLGERFEATLEDALEEIDRGNLALHLIEHAKQLAERREHIHEASVAFAASLQQLQRAALVIQVMQADRADQRLPADSSFEAACAEKLARVAEWRKEAEYGAESARLATEKYQ